MYEKLALTIDEAAQQSNCGRTLIYEALKVGELASVKIGRKRLITPEQLKTWLMAHATGTR